MAKDIKWYEEEIKGLETDKGYYEAFLQQCNETIDEFRKDIAELKEKEKVCEFLDLCPSITLGDDDCDGKDMVFCCYSKFLPRIQQAIEEVEILSKGCNGWMLDKLSKILKGGKQ